MENFSDFKPIQLKARIVIRRKSKSDEAEFYIKFVLGDIGI